MKIIKSIVSFVSRLAKRERTIFYITMGVISLVLLDRIILSPILTKMGELSEIIDIQEEEIEQSLLIVSQEKRIEGETDLYASYLSKPQAEEKAITEFLQDVETLAKKSSVYVVDIKPSIKAIEGATVKHYVKLDFEAQMEQVINFFYNVSNFEDLIKIEGYQIRPKSTGSSVVICNISVSKAIILE